MKDSKRVLIILLSLLTVHFSSAQTWTQRADFGGVARGNSAGFSIGTKGYIGIGNNMSGTRLRDFWEYEPGTGVWTQKADFGGVGRLGAVGFSIGTKGYIGTGSNSSNTKLRDFWEYDPSTNTWTQKADFGGTTRDFAVGFSVDTKGYIGMGTDNTGNRKDFWEYNPSTNTWTQKADFGGTARWLAVGFSIGSKGYIGTGLDASGPGVRDFWEYDPSTNTWIQRANFGGTARYAAVGFSVSNRGYIGMGYDVSNAFKKDFWEYDQATNIWTQKTDFGGAATERAVAFSVGSNGYIGTGATSSGYIRAFWEASLLVLPVELYAFEGYNKPEGRVLSWRTSKEEKCAYFSIERSHDGSLFEPIKNVAAKGKAADYTYTDTYPLSMALYYRLKMVDTDGKVTYSKVITIDAPSAKNIFRIYPNPTVQSVTVLTDTEGVYHISDMSGQIVLTGYLTPQKVIDVSSLPAGIYVLKTATNQARFTKK